MDREGLDSFTLARTVWIEAKRSEATRRDAAHDASLQRRLPATFRRPTRPEHSRRRGKPAGTQAGAQVGRKVTENRAQTGKEP